MSGGKVDHHLWNDKLIFTNSDYDENDEIQIIKHSSYFDNDKIKVFSPQIYRVSMQLDILINNL